MTGVRSENEPKRLLVVIPNWVGDVVMASPVLAAIRARFPHAHIAYLMRRYVGEIVAGGGWHDSALFWSQQRGLRRELALFSLARRIRDEHFDAALLLTNSFRSGLVTWLADVPRRIGFARDGRSWLLTERLRPKRADGRFVPTPVLDSYCELSKALGAPVADRQLRLGIAPEQRSAGEQLLSAYQLNAGAPYAVLIPGAAFGGSKMWPTDRFAAVCDALAERYGLRSVLVGAPGERPVLQAIREQASAPVITCDDPPTTLGSLKVLVQRAALMVCNDTGPRHYANAFNVPTVTLFGPTHQRWTDTDYARERKLQIEVDCGPCQLKKCPLDHRCMTRLSADYVLDAVGDLLGAPENRAARPLPVMDAAAAVGREA